MIGWHIPAITALAVCLSASADAALVAHYDFEEGSGATTADAAGGDHNGALVNGASFIPGGRIGSFAMHFDGVNDFVNLGDNSNLLQNVSAATIATWVRVPTGVNGFRELFALTKSTDVNDERFDVMLFDGAGSEGMFSAGATSSDASEALRATNTQPNDIPDEQWAHIAAVFNFTAKTLVLYVDGNIRSSVTNVPWVNNATTNAPAGKVDLGAAAHGTRGTPFIGDLDDFRIYDTALTTFQIRQLVALPEPTGGATYLATVAAAGLLRRARRRRGWLGLRR